MNFDILQRDGFKVESIYIEKRGLNDFEIPKFEWSNPKSEASKENKDLYISFIKDCFEKSFIDFKIPPASLLNITSDCLPHHLKGTTDVVFYPGSAETMMKVFLIFLLV